eukprot:comp22110_c0_seq1/m.32302 comp22110_c0_seq1/g.32302  ORF comp22110_c0_seq1/g.32302 comp22110_c0_seq1/m.32302 type:complete len:359 (-) comp22110_c0_seq1:645-1721(-)
MTFDGLGNLTQERAVARQDSLPDPGFFEGTEKLLEIWYEPVEGEEKSLRVIPRMELEDLCALVKCTIIGGSSQSKADSYVLSESSMFVFDDKFIIKTCGTTTLLPAVPRLMELAQRICGRDRTRIQDIFYSRRNFLVPEDQQYPHRSFDDEVRYLDKYFDGAAYVLGRLNGDVWYLYTLDRPETEKPFADQTLEVMMMDLDPEAMALYYKNDYFISAKHVTEVSGIADLVPGSNTDEAMFDPCGYSVNGLKDDTYFTIHITPQGSCSYVSFETNAILPNYTEMINKVFEMFKPKRATVTLFANHSAICGSSFKAYDCTKIKGFTRRERQFYEFSKYNLNFGHFERDVQDTPLLQMGQK